MGLVELQVNEGLFFTIQCTQWVCLLICRMSPISVIACVELYRLLFLLTHAHNTRD